MPDACPHCGIRLPVVVDALCPECRRDLSETPGPVGDAPSPTGDDRWAGRSGLERWWHGLPSWTVWYGFLGLVVFSGAVIAAVTGEKERATQYAIAAAAWAAFAAWAYWNPFGRQRIDGKSREQKSQ